VVEAVETVPVPEVRQQLMTEFLSLSERLNATMADLVGAQNRERESSTAVSTLRSRVRLYAESGSAAVCRSAVELELNYARKSWRATAVSIYKEWTKRSREGLGQSESKVNEPVEIPEDSVLAFELKLLDLTENSAKLPDQHVDDNEIALRPGECTQLQNFIALYTREEGSMNEVTCQLFAACLPDEALEVQSEDLRVVLDPDKVRGAFSTLYPAICGLVHLAWPRLDDTSTLLIPRPRHPLFAHHCLAIATLARHARIPFKFDAEL